MLSWNIFPGRIDTLGKHIEHDLVDFQKPFSGNASFAWYLAQKRWPDGFIGPRRGSRNMVPVEKISFYACVSAETVTYRKLVDPNNKP